VFGYEPGAFTDAKTRKPGLLELANHGTFFMDEIAELEAAAQSKLLKVIEEKVYRRLGGVRDVVVDVRFIVATHVDLADQVKRGAFRRDLFYRLNVMQIMIPPLRERGDDVLELAYRFIRELNPQVGRRIRQISDPAVSLLSRYSWPGNVRELRNVIERAMILCMGEVIMPNHLPPDIKEVRRDETLANVETLDQVEAAHIEKVLRMSRGNMKLSSEVLGISRSTLYAKLEKYKLVNPAAEAGEEAKPNEPHAPRRR
jgi:transcriptional regulator with PAS, ATPase and Fis domain